MHTRGVIGCAEERDHLVARTPQESELIQGESPLRGSIVQPTVSRPQPYSLSLKIIKNVGNSRSCPRGVECIHLPLRGLLGASLLTLSVMKKLAHAEYAHPFDFRAE